MEISSVKSQLKFKDETSKILKTLGKVYHAGLVCRGFAVIPRLFVQG